jgi:hypothetical protein
MDTQGFQKNVGSPEVEKESECAIKLVGEKAERKLLGTLSTKARKIHIIPADPKRTGASNIQGGIKVDLILMTLDKAPQMVSIAVPIFGSSPLHLGNSIKGWFNLPFPFEPSVEDCMLYAIVDGTLLGPVKILGSKP